MVKHALFLFKGRRKISRVLPLLYPPSRWIHMLSFSAHPTVTIVVHTQDIDDAEVTTSSPGGINSRYMLLFT